MNFVEEITPQALTQTVDAFELMCRMQTNVGARCIHTDFAPEREVVICENADEIVYFVLRSLNTNAVIAVYGVELAFDLRRAWLRGPFVELTDKNAANDAFDASATALLEAMRSRYSTRIETWDAYVENTHESAIAWLVSRGFSLRKLNSVYSAYARPLATEVAAQIRAPDEQHLDAIVALTTEAFPQGYLTRDDFAAPPSERAATFAWIEHDEVFGCVHASREAGQAEAHVDYLVVATYARRRGVARKLLQTAVEWGFARNGVNRVSLVVVEGNTNALTLYESAGFTLTAVGRHLRWPGL